LERSNARGGVGFSADGEVSSPTFDQIKANISKGIEALGGADSPPAERPGSIGALAAPVSASSGSDSDSEDEKPGWLGRSKK
jgi:hypothetical protein